MPTTLHRTASASYDSKNVTVDSNIRHGDSNKSQGNTRETKWRHLRDYDNHKNNLTQWDEDNAPINSSRM